MSECVVCGAAIGSGRRAAVAPFLARRIWERAPFPVALVTCASCGFRFFNPRLVEEEERRLYAGYRQEGYQRARHASEPWYTAAFNAGLSSPASWRARRERVEAVFDAHLRDFPIRRILDFGGAEGALIETLVPGAERYVYEISGVPPVPGIHALRTLEECRRHRFDLIVSSNVLEHVAHPRELLAQIRAVASPGTLVFLEVPWESPTGLLTTAKRAAQMGLLLARRPPVALSILRTGTLVQMHEHVNYWSPRSLARLVSDAGWQPIARGDYTLGEGPLATRMLWSVDRVTGAAASPSRTA